MKKRQGFWEFLGIFAGITALCGGYFFLSQRVMEAILGRKAPKHMERGARLVSGSDLFTEYAEEIASASAELEGISGFEAVRTVGRDGVELAGHWYGNENPRRVIVAFHGWRSSWSRDFGFIADFWFSRGCSVLFAEQRGQNGSGGDYMGFGILERHDCVAWARWAHEKTEGKLPVYLAGISMGATTVLMASEFALPSSVRGIIADCGFTSPHAIWKHVVEKNLHLPYGLQGVLANEWCRRRFHVGAKECSAVDALKKATVPVLFIHGADDKFVPVEMTYENYKACASEKRLLIVPAAQHGMSYHIDRQGYQNAVTEFWKEFD